MGSPVGGSTLITSAPQSARRADAAGAATQTPSSTTRQVGQRDESGRFGPGHVAAPPD